MNTAVINIKTNPETKARAKKVADELGLSLSSILNAYLKQFIKTKTINFSAKELDEVPNARTRAVFKQAEKNRKAGKGSPLFTSDKELIKKDPIKYRHIDTMQQWLNEQGI